jgi:hypothetical protein
MLLDSFSALLPANARSVESVSGLARSSWDVLQQKRAAMEAAVSDVVSRPNANLSGYEPDAGAASFATA